MNISRMIQVSATIALIGATISVVRAARAGGPDFPFDQCNAAGHRGMYVVCNNLNAVPWGNSCVFSDNYTVVGGSTCNGTQCLIAGLGSNTFSCVRRLRRFGVPLYSVPGL
jgi:hypothetical protein